MIWGVKYAKPTGGRDIFDPTTELGRARHAKFRKGLDALVDRLIQERPKPPPEEPPA